MKASGLFWRVWLLLLVSLFLGIIVLWMFLVGAMPRNKYGYHYHLPNDSDGYHWELTANGFKKIKDFIPGN